MSASVLPARAGMSPHFALVAYFTLCAPRASGDEPPEGELEVADFPCSPRERG